MLYVGPDQQIHDDGFGMSTAPAYMLTSDGQRLELDTAYATSLTRQFQQSFRSRLPLGDAVARVTKAFGVQPCTPCQERQRAMNRFGDRFAEWTGWRR